jgi:Second Messenger Oligonucleotide or Dinucleotide Synthetase domain
VELSGDFARYISSCEPDDDAVTTAKKAHEKVRDELKTDEATKDAHEETFLTGSYRRHTAIHNIEDVDVVCILDLDIHADGSEPEVVLTWLQGALDKYYSETRPQGRSIGVNAKGAWLDIVPATPVYKDGPLWIPDRDAKQWVQSHPKGQISAASEKNKLTDGYYVQTVKLIKSWRDRLPTEKSKPKSYILETLAHQTIGRPASHARAVVSVLEGINSAYGFYRGLGTVPFIADPGLASVNVAKRWGSAEFDAFLDQVKSAATTARQALDATDEAESRKLWRRLFGSTFGA